MYNFQPVSVILSYLINAWCRFRKAIFYFSANSKEIRRNYVAICQTGAPYNIWFFTPPARSRRRRCFGTCAFSIIRDNAATVADAFSVVYSRCILKYNLLSIIIPRYFITGNLVMLWLPTYIGDTSTFFRLDMRTDFVFWSTSWRPFCTNHKLTDPMVRLAFSQMSLSLSAVITAISSANLSMLAPLGILRRRTPSYMMFQSSDPRTNPSATLSDTL